MLGTIPFRFSRGTVHDFLVLPALCYFYILLKLKVFDYSKKKQYSYFYRMEKVFPTYYWSEATTWCVSDTRFARSRTRSPAATWTKNGFALPVATPSKVPNQLNFAGYSCWTVNADPNSLHPAFRPESITESRYHPWTIDPLFFWQLCSMWDGCSGGKLVEFIHQRQAAYTPHGSVAGGVDSSESGIR